jgi:hypothetical protein
MAQIGDILYLKSGSRPLTVEKLSRGQDGDLLGVVWSNGSALLRADLPATVLVDTDPSPAIDAARREQVEALKGETP